MDAIAPPIAQAAPVVPDQQVAQNAAVSPVPVTQSIIDVKPSDQIDSAVAQKNPVMLNSLAQRFANTPEGQASADLAKRIQAGQKEFADLTKNIDPNTPEGRLAALKTYKTVRDEPRYGDALMMYMAGDKLGAMQSITGGKTETKIEYLPATGRMVIKKVNQLGEPVSVEDAQSGQIIPMQEYAKLGGSVSALENTMYWKTRSTLQDAYTKDFANATKIYNAIDTSATAKAPLVNEYTNIMKEMLNRPDISKEDRQKIAGMVSGQISYAQSLSDARNTLDNFSRTKGQGMSADDKKAIEGALGQVGDATGIKGLKIGANNTITDSSNNTWNASKLAQLMDGRTIGKQLDKSYSQNQEALLQATKIGLLSNEDYLKLQRALDLNNQIQKMNVDVATNHGNPLFTVPTTGSSMADQAHRPLAQAMQEQFNIEVSQAFNKWRKQQMEQAVKAGATDYVPEPGELESAFTQTPYYKAKQKEYSKKIVDVINTPYVSATTSNIPAGISSIGGKQEATLNQSMPSVVSPSAAGQAEMAAEETKRKEDLKQKFRNEHTTRGR